LLSNENLYINKLCTQLINGKIGLVSIKGIWGLICHAKSNEAIEKIFAIKKSKNLNSFSLLLNNEEELKDYFEQPNIKVIDYLIGIGKPEIVVYNNAKNIAKNVIKKDGSFAAQILSQNHICALIKQYINLPLLHTQARIANEPIPTDFKNINPNVINAVDFIIEQNEYDTYNKKYLSKIKWHADGSLEIISH
jgi:L-threonylcarbamoyladenylate synthase